MSARSTSPRPGSPAPAPIAAIDGSTRWVAGAFGPTNKTLSLSPNVNDPGYREVDFDEDEGVYREQIEALLEGGVDFILIETMFDTLNAKAGIMAAHEAGGARPDLPLMISMTLTDLAGRNLSGQTVEASGLGAARQPVTMGLNCSFGATQLRPHLAAPGGGRRDARSWPIPMPACPTNSAAMTSGRGDGGAGREWIEDGLVNIVGGCCGTTAAHIAAMVGAVAGYQPRAIPTVERRTRLAGIEPMVLAA